MYGKVVKISEYELKFGAKEQKINIFICCKSLNNGNTYIIYNKVNDNKNKIYYGNVHISGNKIISMEPKNGSEEIIKEIIFKIINNQDLDSYKVLNINNIDKIEIISSKDLNMKSEIIAKLIDNTIPKETKTEEINLNKNKGYGFLIFIIIVLIIGIGGITVYDIVNKRIGYGQELLCTIDSSNTKINAFINKKVDVLYNRLDDIEKIIENSSYTFNNYDNYNNFREKGTYYDYISKNNDNSGIKWDDDTYTFRNIITLDKDIEYFIDDSKISLKGNINEDIAIFQNQGYTCIKQKREE